MSNFLFWYVLVCNSVVYLKEKGFGVMYIAVTGSKNNKDVLFINHSVKRTENHHLVSTRSLENTILCWNSLMVIMKNLWLGRKAKLPKKPNFTMNAPGKLRLNSLKLPAFL